MKAIIVTKENNRIEGKVCLLGDYIVTLDVKRKLIDRQLFTALYNEGIMVDDSTFWWHITIARSKVESIEFID